MGLPFRKLTENQYARILGTLVDHMNNSSYAPDDRDMWKESALFLKTMYDHQDDEKSALMRNSWSRLQEPRYLRALQLIDKAIDVDIRKGIIEKPEDFEPVKPIVDVPSGGRDYDTPEQRGVGSGGSRKRS